MFILLFTSPLLLISTFLYLSSPIHRKPINIENPQYALKSKRELSRMAINLFIPKRVRIICVNITLTICHLHLGGKFYCCRKSVKNHLLKTVHPVHFRLPYDCLQNRVMMFNPQCDRIITYQKIYSMNSYAIIYQSLYVLGDFFRFCSLFIKEFPMMFFSNYWSKLCCCSLYQSRLIDNLNIPSYMYEHTCAPSLTNNPEIKWTDVW